MKKTKIFTIVLIISGLLMPSCKDSFLEQPPLGAYAESALLNPAGMNGYLVGVYSVLNGAGIFNTLTTSADAILISSIHSDEAFKGSTSVDQPVMDEFANFNVTTGNGQILALWRYNYDAIARCNKILAALPLATGLTDGEKTEIAAETRFLRGHFYFFLKRAFKNIPWIDETSADVRIPNTVDNDGVTYVNCWPQITADFDFARKNLAATQADRGRPNNWAAQAYYAKVLIYRNNESDPTLTAEEGYDDALVVLTNVINSGTNVSGVPYDLEANYHDLFNCLTENGKEIVWDVQNSVNDGTVNGNNGDQKYWVMTQNATGPGMGRGWGFYAPTPWYADQFRTSGKGLPYLDFYATNPTRLKDDYGVPNAPAPTTAIPYPADPGFVVDTIGLDPRIDWTITRRGIPCLDYGNMPGRSWIREQASAGPYISKKFYILRSQDGTFTYSGNANTALNVHVIRFADVLLLAAECQARTNTGDLGRALVNRVRQRMINNSASNQNRVKKIDLATGLPTNTDAANYRINIYPTGGANDPFTAQASALNAILFERGLELGTEGHRFWDVTRFGRAEEIFNAYLAKEKVRYTNIRDGNYIEARDRYLPIPRDAVDRSRVGATATLTQSPGY
jgi:hypothetical protein